MIRVLITGMSGTGKSTVLGALAALGHKTADTDHGWSTTAPDGEWLWDESKIDQLLATEDADVLFVGGCASNQVRFYGRFDHIVLLSAPAEILIERLATRTTNSYGKAPDELARTLDNLAVVEPLLRKVASHEIASTLAVEEIARELEALVRTGV